MRMRQRIARLFMIKTRTEAWLVIYAIALGAVERARHYLELYPGSMGMVLAVACTGVVFLAGAKLLDSVRPEPARATAGPYLARGRSRVSRSRPRARPLRSDSTLPTLRRKD